MNKVFKTSMLIGKYCHPVCLSKIGCMLLLVNKGFA